MSTGKIEVWIVGRESLCSVSQQEWKVCLLDCCSRRVVVFCDRELCEATKCGTVEFDVPPGCYFILARAANDIAFGVDGEGHIRLKASGDERGIGAVGSGREHAHHNHGGRSPRKASMRIFCEISCPTRAATFIRGSGAGFTVPASRSE